MPYKDPEKQREAQRRSILKRKIERKEKQILRRKIRNNSGLCRCGKVLDSTLHTCKTCRDRSRKRYNLVKDQVYLHYGGYICKCCGETNPLFLSLDHINGVKDRKIEENLRGISDADKTFYYHWLIRNNFPTKLQVLCMNCNWGRARNNGICPHQSQRENLLLEATSS